ncbi:MAG: class I adenylate-forming enzyme family protein, partial [Reyranella sp.]|uniref:class I adenylate-forming enzyme family protein n=1 Tax=Reyranella sp. TaxID=1929291 RepID=UPI003D0E12FE
RTLGDLVDALAAATPAAPAVVSGDERLDYATLKQRVDTFARALMASGVRHGDRVALLVSNRIEWIVAALASARIGAIVAAISTFSTPRELAWTLEHCGASALVMLPEFRGRRFLEPLAALCPELEQDAAGPLRSTRLPALRTVVVLDGPAPATAFTWSGFLARASSVDAKQFAAAQAAVAPTDLCYILYTSGSTAAPKGVTLAHGPLIDNGFEIGERMHLSSADRVWLAVPLFWSFGSANALPAIMTHGGCVVLQESFEPGETLALIEREHCSVYYGMVNMARALMEHPTHPGRRLGAMRTGLTIGPPEDIALTIRALGADKLCNVYGSTETYGNCAVTDAEEPLQMRLERQGLPLPGMTIRAVDPVTRRPLPQGEVGELAVHGRITPGYYRAPEANAEAFDRDGFFLTGDLGSIEADGRVRFRGRLKEMIKTGGVNVAPLEVEHVLMQHPDVVQAYVVGVPDATRGEAVAAAIELRAGSTSDGAAVIAFCRERLASYKVPARLVVRTAAEFPRTATGKIHKPGLRAEFSTLLPSSAGEVSASSQTEES